MSKPHTVETDLTAWLGYPVAPDPCIVEEWRKLIKEFSTFVADKAPDLYWKTTYERVETGYQHSMVIDGYMHKFDEKVFSPGELASIIDEAKQYILTKVKRS